MEDIIIKDATINDSYLIADAIINAIGEELTMNMAGGQGKEKVHDIFRRLAEREDTQYSYRNTRIALSSEGAPMGVCVSYDGARLKKLRVPFFEEARQLLGWKISDEEIDSLPGETDEHEYYLDSLMTLPKYRKRGVAKSLIIDASKKARGAGKPLGLLCDFENKGARKLYEAVGLKEVGSRPFAGHMMAHMMM